MNKHLSSFFLSVVIHVTLLAGIYVAYKTISQSLSQKEHPCQCCSTTIYLSAIQTEKKVVPAQPKQIVKSKPKPKVKVTKQKKKMKREKIAPQKVQQPKRVMQDNNITKPINLTKNTIQQKGCDKKVIAPPVKKQDSKDYLSLHVRHIVTLLKENLYYPRRARKRGIEGVVQVRFTLNKDATISNVKVLQSDFDILANAALKTIKELDGVLPKPDEVLTLTIPIEYSLN